MIRLGRESVIVEFSDQLLIPRAAQHARAYLASLWDYIIDLGAPVTLRTDRASGAGIALDECLVVEPTGKRLRFYQTLHYAQPENAALRVGYYLIGGDRAAWGSAFGGETFGIGRPSDADVDNVISIVEMIRDHAVKPAVRDVIDIADAAPGRSGLGAS